MRLQDDSCLGVTGYQLERFRLGKGSKMKTRMQKLLWKLFPNTTYSIWIGAHNKGMELGRSAEQREVEKRLMMHHVKAFGKPSLTLGYETARNAAMNRIEI
jgi:hypothetical protein